ncbi:hypothetical protein CEXT_809931 [Caerostris extrusa]|uniref:Uncharacterized protein n=1 Tax=Caerostris extrusa TaxID=172846 RepID=A0AAV4XC61_CAEEX|nr:hypothetical protein CEXT_809931 [Caerostris extrusa]
MRYPLHCSLDRRPQANHQKVFCTGVARFVVANDCVAYEFFIKRGGREEESAPGEQNTDFSLSVTRNQCSRYTCADRLPLRCPGVSCSRLKIQIVPETRRIFLPPLTFFYLPCGSSRLPPVVATSVGDLRPYVFCLRRFLVA